MNGSLDSALKKNTAFIKRLRTGTSASALQTVLADIRTLSLHKYLSEIVSACYEGLCKSKSPGEIAAGIEVVSALHQRFGPPEFTKQLGWLLGRGLNAPDKAHLKSLSQDVREREEKDRLSRQRVLLRLVTELWLVGVLKTLDDIERPDVRATDSSKPTTDPKVKPPPSSAAAGKESEPFPLEVLKELLRHDRDHSNLPLAVAFVKGFAWDVLGVKPAGDGGKMAAEDPSANGGDEQQQNGTTVAADDPPLASEKVQARFRNVLVRYLEDVKAHVVRDQRALAGQSRRNAETYVRSGEIFEDRQANFEKQTKALERLISNAQALCEVLGVDMPTSVEKEEPDSTAGGGGAIGLVKTTEYLRGQGEGPGIWEDEEERRFYENLVDLKGKVPAVLLDDGKKKKQQQSETKATDGGGEPVKVEPDEKASEEKAAAAAAAAAKADEQSSTTIANVTIGSQVDAVLARLPELQTKDQVDRLALDFCFLNSKASRNRLVKTVSDVPRGRSDLLPFYARLVATLGQYLPDIPQGLITYLDEEFRSLQRRKSREFLGQVRMGNIRYLAELTKFGVVPEHVIFHCFKVALDDFSRMNIEIIGHLLENCGRYMLRNPETAPRMASFLETLGRKKAVQHLGQQERMILENAIYYVDPPPRPAIQRKERPPMELYIRRLLYLDMNKRSYPRILKSVRKLHWEEPEVFKPFKKKKKIFFFFLSVQHANENNKRLLICCKGCSVNQPRSTTAISVSSLPLLVTCTDTIKLLWWTLWTMSWNRSPWASS